MTGWGAGSRLMVRGETHLTLEGSQMEASFNSGTAKCKEILTVFNKKSNGINSHEFIFFVFLLKMKWFYTHFVPSFCVLQGALFLPCLSNENEIFCRRFCTLKKKSFTREMKNQLAMKSTSGIIMNQHGTD